MDPYIAWIHASIIIVIFLIFAVRNIKHFLSLTGDKTARYPVIGYKRITIWQIIPCIVTVVEKDGIQHILKGFSNAQIKKIPPPGTKILCHQNANGIEFRSFVLLAIPSLLISVCSAFMITLMHMQGIIYYIVFGIFVVIPLILMILDRWQIYGSRFLINMFTTPPYNNNLKLSPDEYTSMVINKEKIFSYDEAFAIAKKENIPQFLTQTLLPVGIILILSYILKSITS